MNFKINKFLRANLLGFLSGAILLLFSFGCSKADAPPDDGNPGNGNPGNSTTTDDHGNARTSATPATAGTPIAGNIETGDDQDYFSIVVPRAGTLRATTTGDVNTIGHLYDSSGRELAANDDDGEGMNFNVSAQITSAGTYYVRVTSAGSGTGMYNLTVTFIPDDHGNTRGSATSITSGTQIAGNIETGDDQDYFSIVVPSTGTLRAVTTGTTNTMGNLYDGDGMQLATNDDGGEGMNFNVSAPITGAGTYYVRVTSAGSGTGMYRLTVIFDDHGNTILSATPVTNGIGVAGNIETSDDQDYFSIEVPSAGTLRASTTGDVNTMGAVYGSSGMELAMNDDDGEGMNFNVSAPITGAGTYYVRVTSAGSGTGVYRLTVTLVSDDHGNTIASATPATIGGTPTAGEIDPGTDIDYFSIDVTRAHLASIDLLVLRVATTGMIDTMGALYDSDGNELATDDNGGTDTNFEISYGSIAVPGTYYVKVTSAGSGMYSLAVTSTSADHGNTRATATPVIKGSAITGNIDPGTDEDYFSIEVTSTDLSDRGSVILKASTTGSTNTIGHLYDSGGMVLAMHTPSIVTNFQFAHKITSTGTYYVRVTGSNTGLYSLTITLEDHGNTRDQATQVTIGTPIDGNLETTVDTDYFSIVVSSTDLAGVDLLELRASVTGTDATGSLYDSDGDQLVADPNIRTGANFDVSYVINTAGTYYVSLTGNSNNDIGMYRLTVTTMDGDHSNDGDRSATPITVGEAIAGNIDPGTDRDYFLIQFINSDLADADIFTLRAAITTSVAHTMVAIYDSGGTQLAANDNGGAGTNFDVSYEITIADTYYVRVTNNMGNTGMYSLTVTTTNIDHGDAISTATPITNGVAVTGRIPSMDEDYFSIVVTRSGTLKAMAGDGTHGSNMLTTIGTLYDSSGMRVGMISNGDGASSHFSFSRSIAAGTYYVRVTGHGGSVGAYELTVTFDSHGDTANMATSVASGVAVTGDITSGDTDYFKIDVPNGGGGTLTATSTGTDVRGNLYDTDGSTALLEEPHDDIFFPSNTNFWFSHQVNCPTTMAMDPCTYYIEVDTLAFTPGEYTLTVTLIADHGGTQASATSVTNGLVITGEIDSTGTDEDYFSIVVPRAGILTAATTGETNTVGAIYDSGGTQLATNDDGGTGMNFDVSSSVTAGTYYVRVTGSGSSTGEYSLTVIYDDHGDTQASATMVTSGMAVDGNIEIEDDEDWFSIVVTGPGTLRAVTTGSTDTIGALYDNDGMELPINNNGGTGTNFDLSYSITTAGTYYIEVGGFSMGEYSLTVTFTPATMVTSGTPVTGNLETNNDEDWFSIVVTGPGTLRAATTGSTDTVGTLYDSNGDELATANDGGTGTNFDVSYNVATAGTYYIKVSSFRSDTGAYSLTATFTP